MARVRRLNVEGGYFANLNGDPSNDLRLFDSRANSLVLQMLQLVAEKEPTLPHPLGFRVNVIAGDAARFLHARSMGSFVNPVDLTEAYLRYKAPVGRGLDVEVGKFLTFVGLESTPAVDNVNYSRGFLYNYAIPFTHTGARVRYEFSDRFNASLHLVNGWDDLHDDNGGKTWGASLGYNPNDRVSLYFNIMSGPENDTAIHANRLLFDWVHTVKLGKDWQLGIGFDYGQENFADSHGNVRWSGAVGTLRHNFNDVFSLGLRGELFDDTNGHRTGIPQSLREITLTPEIRLPAGVILRPEIRHDWSNVASFHHGTRKSQDTVGIGILYQYTC